MAPVKERAAKQPAPVPDGRADAIPGRRAGNGVFSMWTLGYASSTSYGRRPERDGIEPLAAHWRTARGHVVAGQPVRPRAVAAGAGQDQAGRSRGHGAGPGRRGRHRRRDSRPAARAVAGRGRRRDGRPGRAEGAVAPALSSDIRRYPRDRRPIAAAAPRAQPGRHDPGARPRHQRRRGRLVQVLGDAGPDRRGRHRGSRGQPGGPGRLFPARRAASG